MARSHHGYHPKWPVRARGSGCWDLEIPKPGSDTMKGSLECQVSYISLGEAENVMFFVVFLRGKFWEGSELVYLVQTNHGTLGLPGAGPSCPKAAPPSSAAIRTVLAVLTATALPMVVVGTHFTFLLIVV